MAIYLAGPIDETDDGSTWRTRIGESLPPGVIAIDPFHGVHGDGPRTAQVVDRTNRWMIHASDGLLVNLEERAAAFGTIREIEFARAKGKPVVVVSPDIIHSLSAHDVFQEDTLERGLGRLVEAITDRLEAPAVHPMLMIGFGEAPEVDDD
jgi:nucleoside 2-deoxyribosyltransferase